MVVARAMLARAVCAHSASSVVRVLAPSRQGVVVPAIAPCPSPSRLRHPLVALVVIVPARPGVGVAVGVVVDCTVAVAVDCTAPLVVGCIAPATAAQPESARRPCPPSVSWSVSQLAWMT